MVLPGRIGFVFAATTALLLCEIGCVCSAAGADAQPHYGGVFGSYLYSLELRPFIECEDPNRFTGRCSCPQGYTGEVTGRIMNDGGGTGDFGGYLWYCADGTLYPASGWGGSYQEDANVTDGQGCRFPNKYTGACTCPSGFQPITAQVLTDLDGSGAKLIESYVSFCWANSSLSEAYAFGGAYQTNEYGTGCLTANPATGDCSCSSDFPVLQLLRVVKTSGFRHEMGPVYVCERGTANPIMVHAVPHTHDDPGWLETVEGYYDCCVKNILDTVTQSLAENPNRRFTYVEMSFFTIWWNQQTDDVKSLVKKLVSTGQLDFTIGGWVMPDEACPSYTDLIDQMTAGHLFLKDTFGETSVPTVGWQIDPFGHSNGNTWTYSQFDFDFLVEVRIDYKDIDWRRANVEMEWIWRPFRSFDEYPEKQDIFSFELYNHYGWPPGRTVTDSVGNDLTLSETTKESLHKRRLTASTVTWDPVAFSHWTYNTVNSYKTLNILAPMGNDFEWQNAEPDFVGLDELISFFEDHSEYGINLFYSTPATVGNTLLSASESLSLKTDDFFPYSDTFNDYWTGYFTSHPAFKRYVRTSSALFHSARQIHTLASSDVKLLDSLDAPWHAISVTQHHDAITGTSKSFVYDDYLSQLDDGNNASAAVILSSLSALDSSIPSSWELCPPIKEDPSYCSELGAGRMVMVLNSIGSSQDIPINLQVSSDALCVFDSDGTETTSQIREAPWVSGLNLFELSFMAEDMPSLGARTYSLESCSKAEKITNKVSSPQATVSIENNFYKLSFDTATNTLSSILEKTNGNTVSINIDVLYYVPEGSPLIPRDGAYVFNTRKSPLSFPGPRGALTTFYGDVYQEVEIIVDQASNVIQRFRLNKNDPFIEMYTTVGPISTTDKNGKEVIVKIQSPISSAGFLYTDTHNLEFQKREYNVLYGKYIMDNDISGNYYPISSAAYIQDDNLMLAILPDRAQGAASLTNGSLEVMIHRRLLEDGDHKGVGEPLDDSTAICTKQLLILSSTDSGISTLRSAALRHEHSPAVLSSISGTTPAPFSWSPMSVSLPANVHLTTLQVTRYDIFGASTLVRLHHNFAVDEDPVLSQPATVDLSSLFADWTVTSAVEVSLSAAHKVQSLSSMTITLNPMEFKTFAVSLTKKQ